MTLLYWIAAATPSATPGIPDDVDVTPGWIGFAVMFAIAIATVLLIIDMTRRVRRVRYRAEVRELLDAEESSDS
jgi:TRAP-type C4-dicarboxylate transport system permease small subunit